MVVCTRDMRSLYLYLYPCDLPSINRLSSAPMSSSSHPNVSFLQFEAIFDASLEEYAQKTGMDLAAHPLATTLEVCDRPEAVPDVLRKEAQAFDEYRNGDRKVRLMKRLKSTVDIVFELSTCGVFGEGIGLVGHINSIRCNVYVQLSHFFLQMFPPAKAIFTGVGILLAVRVSFLHELQGVSPDLTFKVFQAAKGVSTSYDALIDLFECSEQYLSRLKIFAEIPSAMGEILIKIMVELLGVLALATQQIKLGRFSEFVPHGASLLAQNDAEKFAKKLLGENDIESVLQRLDRLTTEESRMTAAQTMQVVQGLFNNVKMVMDGMPAFANMPPRCIEFCPIDGRSSTDKIQRALSALILPVHVTVADRGVSHDATDSG